MSTCEVCLEEKKKVVACRMCGIHFCDECGYPEKNLCNDCATQEEEGEEDEAEETYEESI